MKAKPGGSGEPKHVKIFARLTSAPAMLAAGLTAGSAIAAPSYPPALDRAALSAWLADATGLAPEQVVAVSASAIAAEIARAERPDGRTEMLLRAVSLSPEATARGGVLAWEVKLGVDCRTGEIRAGATRGYSSQKAEGEAIPLAPEETAWRRPRPATTMDNAWRAACDPSFQRPLGGAVQLRASLSAPTPAAASRPATSHTRDTAATAPESAPSAKPGRWVAQVVSSPDQNDTRQALASLRGRYGELLQALETRVEAAQVRGRTVYRGVVAGFGSAGAASEFCAALKRDGRDCLAR